MQEDADRAEDKLRELEDAGLVRVGLSHFRRLVLRINLRQWRVSHQEAKDEQRAADDGVGQHDALEKTVENQGSFGLAHQGEAGVKLGVRWTNDERSKRQRRQDARALVADSHDADPAGGALFRPKDSDVGIGRGLQDGQSGAEREQASQENSVGARERRGDEEEGPGGHHPEANAHPLFKTGPFEQVGRRHRENQIGRIEGGGDPIRLEMREPKSVLEEGDQGRVHPGDRPEDAE